MLRAYLCEYCSVGRKNQLDYLCSFSAPIKTHIQSQGGGVFHVAQARSALLGAYRSSQDLSVAGAVTSYHTYGKHLTAKSIIKTYFYVFEPGKKLSAKLIAKLTFHRLSLNRSFTSWTLWPLGRPQILQVRKPAIGLKECGWSDPRRASCSRTTFAPFSLMLAYFWIKQYSPSFSPLAGSAVLA